MSQLDILTKMADDLLVEEGLTKEILDYVDLDVAFSPVLVRRGETQPVTVSESNDPNRFLLDHPSYPAGWCSRDDLRIMRARYLLAIVGPPNPEPIATFDTTTQKGRDDARDFMSALGMGAIADKFIKP